MEALERFGEQYEQYAENIPRFIPQIRWDQRPFFIRNWRSDDEINVSLMKPYLGEIMFMMIIRIVQNKSIRE